MPKKFPDLKSDEEAEDWLQSADLTRYDLSDMKKVRFELAPKDASISLRLPAGLLATLRARAAEAKMPTQRFIRVLLGRPGRKPGQVEAKTGGEGSASRRGGAETGGLSWIYSPNLTKRDKRARLQGRRRSLAFKT